MAEKPKNRPKPNGDTLAFGLLKRTREAGEKPKIQPVWPMICTLMALMLVGLFFAHGAARWAQFKYILKYDDVKITDMLLHIRWVFPDKVRENFNELGNHYHKLSKEFAQEGDFKQSFYFARHGVLRAPENLEGRLRLAGYWSLLKNEEYLLATLEGGLQYTDERNDITNEYITLYLTSLIELQEDYKVIEYADSVLPQQPEQNYRNQMVAMFTAQAHYLRGNFDRAEDYLVDYRLIEAPEGRLLSAIISWERGEKDQALEKLDAAIRRFPEDQRFYVQASTYCREMGDYDKAIKYATLRGIAEPDQPNSRVEIITALRHMERDEEADRKTEQFIKIFSDDPKAMSQLANSATYFGDTKLVRRIYELALEQGFDMSEFALYFIESCITEKDFQRAIEFAEDLESEQPSWLVEHESVFFSLQSVAYYGAGRPDLGSLYLGKFMNHGDRPEAAKAYSVAQKYQKLGMLKEARKTLQYAYQQLPENQKILSSLVELDLDMGNSQQLPQHLRKLLTMRRPSTRLLERSYEDLGSDRFIFAENREDLLLELEGMLNRSSRG